jgi:membrane protease subunit HflK
LAPEDETELDTDQRIRRSTARTIVNWFAGLLSVAVIGGWALNGFYYVEPGQSAVILRIGKYHRTEPEPGWRWHLPPPLEYSQLVDVTKLRRLEFGTGGGGPSAQGADGTSVRISENSIQTADSNIVIPRYVLQYTIRDPFAYLYAVRDPAQILHDAAQAAVREVIGSHSIDAVLSANRAGIEDESKLVLERTLLDYAGGDQARVPFEIRAVQLQDVQPPPEVQDAFDDVISAKQDEDRVVSVAEGDSREIREKANGEVAELRERAEAYRETKILEAGGRAARFEAQLAEYRLAKDVTRRRLYIETMEEVLPDVEKIVIEPDAARLLPLLSLPTRREGGS